MPYDQHFFHQGHDGPNLTTHARKRMDARRLSKAAVRAAFDYGREVHIRGAAFHVIGRKEVQRWREHGVDLSGFEGVHVVCSTDGKVLTVYRNHNLRGLRPQHRQHRYRS